MVVPRTRYAVTPDGVNIAYQRFGRGDARMIVSHAWISNIETYWERRQFVAFMEALAAHGEVVQFDKRGTGLSDRMVGVPTFEARLDDVTGVIDAVGWDRAALIGYGDGGALAAAFSATYPDRCQALVLEGTGAFTVRHTTDNPTGITFDKFLADTDLQRRHWGDPDAGALFAELVEDSESRLNDDPAFGPWFAKMLRTSAGRGDVEAIDRVWYETDASSVIDTISVPTALYYRSGWDAASIEATHQLAARIRGATLIEAPGIGYPPWADHGAALGDAIGRFVASVADEDAALDRVLATVLFTDLVGSTERASREGDRAWRELAGEHLRRARAILRRRRGTLMDTAGDGIFATFDGPGRALKAGLEIVAEMAELGLEVRAGVHTGEVTRIEGKAGGMAVLVGARVGASAAAGELRTTRTVRDLVAGGGFTFADLGEHELKGLPDRWQLYRVGDAEHPIA